MSSTSVTFWVPNLLSVTKVADANGALQTIRLPALETLLAKADRLPIKSQSFYQTASYLFHQPTELPAATLMASQEITDYEVDAFWLRVDPVQMIPDRDTLVLIPSSELALTIEESQALIASFNAHFEQDKVRLEYGDVTHWYIRIVQEIDIHTQSLEQVAFKSLKDAFPTGNASTYWRQLMNEAQMLFFNHPVNLARQEKGLPEVNSVWVWGEGRLPVSKIVKRPNTLVCAKHPYLKGVAEFTEATYDDSISDIPAWQILLEKQPFEHSLILPELQTENTMGLSQDDWIQSLVDMEDNWFSGLMESLRAKKIHSLLIDLGMSHRYHLTPSHLNKFWKFKRPISTYRV